jgi:alkylation response protein AidB-like acyl-CoA dehydrogenase
VTVDSDAALLLDTVEHFAAKAEQRLFGVELPDGDLDSVGDLLLDAAAIGVLADADPQAGGWGVWGSHVDAAGVGLSLAMLRRLGRVCAGLATAVHAQGLGVLLLGSDASRVPLGDGARLLAGFCPPVGVPLDPRTFGDGLVVENGRLHGVARFALLAGTADLAVLAARTADATWELLAIPVGTEGLRLVPAGERVGLRACRVVDVHADGVDSGACYSLQRGAAAENRLRATLACDWLGQAAIALGCAERAVTDAIAYAATRVQGGVPIGVHAAVRLLLGRGEHDLAVLADVLERHTATGLTDLAPDTLLRWGIDARLAAGEHATRAVTDALQTLGGYGYMDDYGLSKRLRDTTALRVLHAGPDQLLLLRHDLEAAR